MKKFSTFVLTLLISATAWAGTAQTPQAALSSAAEKPAILTADKPQGNQRTDRPEGDTIEDAITMEIGDCVSNDTGADFADDYDEVCPYEGSDSPDVVYTFFLDHQAILEFDMCNAQYDCKVYVYNASLELVGCNDDACESPQGDPYRSFLTIVDMPIDEYYVVCDGYGGEMGTFELCITEGDPAEYDIHQIVHTPGDSWSAGTSHTNGDDVDYLRADRFGNAGTITQVTVWGLSLIYDNGWSECSEDPMAFDVMFYEADGMPGAELANFDIECSPVATGDAYAGYPLYQFDLVLPESVDLVEGWVGMQTYGNCWFLWMSAYEVDGWSALSTDGGAWETYDYDLAYQLTLGEGVAPIGNPVSVVLHDNHPNPFNPVTTISYDLVTAQPVELVVFNTAGERVATLVDGSQAAGLHSLQFDAQHLPSGVYFYRLTTGEFSQTQRMLLVK